ncbi:MAG: phosphatidylserine decarboxylase [Planctomycetes bacterium]|nr:phosphatidylserine decarboxylase [Planctomycetota bacterium]
MSEIRFRDRETGELRAELVFGEKELRFLYEHWLGRLMTNLILHRETLNHVYGWFQRRPKSARRIPDFIARLGIDPDEAERPVSEYASLDDFFTRRLKPGARPIDRDPSHLISPADGRVLVYPRVRGEMRVKGSSVGIAELAGRPEWGARYEGGDAVVVRLAPADYHRFHFPETGVASEAARAGRGLHSVHPIALAAGAPSFRNKRMITRLATETFGELLLIEVGALIVGTIVQTYRPGPIERGQEKGTFRFGGSTVVMLVEPGRVVLDGDLVQASAQGVETFVKMGSRVAVRRLRTQRGTEDPEKDEEPTPEDAEDPEKRR